MSDSTVKQLCDVLDKEFGRDPRFTALRLEWAAKTLLLAIGDAAAAGEVPLRRRIGDVLLLSRMLAGIMRPSSKTTTPAKARRR